MTGYVADVNGRWIALVRPEVALMLPRTAEAVPDLWAALAAPDPIGAVLGRLTRDGIADVPPFAVVADSDERRRVMVRGGFRVVAAGEEITASGVSTWVERVIDADAPYELVAPFAAAAEAGDAWPIVEGMVPASIVRSDGVVEVADPPRPPAAAAPPAPVTAETPVVADTPAVAEETMVPPADAPVDDAVDDETIIVSRPAAPTPATASAPSTGAPAARPAPPAYHAPTGDHDGLTIAVTKLQELRRRPKPGAQPETSASPDAPDAPEAPTVSVRLPGGAAETLTGEIVLGRSPSVSRASGTKLPRLVTIGTGDPDISRSHVRIGLEGGTVVVTDLHSRNGTSVVQPGRPPVKLRAGEPTPVLVGTVIDLGGGCEIAVVAG